MTDQQIVNFIEYRAKKNGVEFKLHDPKLAVFINGNKRVFLGLKFANHSNVFFIRFWKNDIRAIARIKLDADDFKEWLERNSIDAKPFIFKTIDYDLDLLPKSLIHYVSYSIISALKQENVGLDSYTLDMIDIPLIDPKETYEEASIEVDLMCGLIG